MSNNAITLPPWELHTDARRKVQEIVQVKKNCPTGQCKQLYLKNWTLEKGRAAMQ